MPVAVRMKSNEGEPRNFARLKKDHPLEKYTLEELLDEYEGLTGEDIGDIILLAGVDRSIESVRMILHFAILHANIVGAPRGQPLRSGAIQQPTAQGTTAPAATGRLY